MKYLFNCIPVPAKPPNSLFLSSDSECSDAGEDSTSKTKKRLSEVIVPSAKVGIQI